MKYELLGENGQVEDSRMPPDKKSKSKVTTPEKSQRLVLDLGPEAIVVELLNCLAIKKKKKHKDFDYYKHNLSASSVAIHFPKCSLY